MRKRDGQEEMIRKGSRFEKALSSVYRPPSSFPKVLSEAATQARGCGEPRSLQQNSGEKGWSGTDTQREGRRKRRGEQSNRAAVGSGIHLSRETVIS